MKLGTYSWGAQLEERDNTTNTFGSWDSFFRSPEFLYFQSVVVTLWAANVVFLLLTVYFLVEHWRNAANVIKTETKGNFLIVLKLFFIMGKCKALLVCRR